jgi:hypothetical protein
LVKEFLAKKLLSTTLLYTTPHHQEDVEFVEQLDLFGIDPLYTNIPTLQGIWSMIHYQ